MTTFKAHDKPVYGLAFAPDGLSLLTSSGDELMLLWSLDPIAKTREWPGSGHVCPVAFSPDGRFVAHGGRETSVWPVNADEKPVITTTFTEAIAFSPDSAVFIAHGNSCAELQRWTLPKPKELAGGWGGTRESTGGEQFPTGGMACSPDGKLLATTFGVLTPGRYVSVVYLWDAKSGQQLGALAAKVPDEHPTALSFSPDGKLLAGASGRLMRIWDVGARKEIANLQLTKKHFKGQVFSPDGKSLLTVGQDELVTRWRVKGWTKWEEIDAGIGKLTAVARTPDGAPSRRFAVGSARGKVAIWDHVR